MKSEITVRALPENPEDTPATVEQLINAAAQEDGYWLQRVGEAFAKGGFTVRRLEREPAHLSVWTAWLTASRVGRPGDKKGSAKQIRKVLAQAGLKIRAGELSVLDHRRNGNVKCAFVLGTELPPVDF